MNTNTAPEKKKTQDNSLPSPTSKNIKISVFKLFHIQLEGYSSEEIVPILVGIKKLVRPILLFLLFLAILYNWNDLYANLEKVISAWTPP